MDNNGSEFDFGDLVDGVLGEESDANEQKVADADEEPNEDNVTDSDDGEEQAEDEEEESKEKGEENLGIRFKKAKAKNEKLEVELNELKKKLALLESKDDGKQTVAEKKSDDKQIDILSKEIAELKKDKLRNEFKQREELFFSEHPELAKEKAKYNRGIENYLKANPEIASAFVNNKISHEQVHILMGGKPKSVVADSTKVFGTAGVDVSNPRVAKNEKTAYETALEILDKNEITQEEHELATNTMLDDIASSFLK